MKSQLRWNELQTFLNEKVERYNRPDFIDADPVSIPHQFTKKEDIEIAGFLAATIAWGNRKSIVTNAHRMMAIMDHSPHDFVMHHTPRDLNRARGFVHRTFNEADFRQFVVSLRYIYQKEASLPWCFLR